MPAVLAAGFRPVYLGLFWGVIHPMSMLSLATATGPSYFFQVDRSGPLLGQTFWLPGYVPIGTGAVGSVSSQPCSGPTFE